MLIEYVHEICFAPLNIRVRAFSSILFCLTIAAFSAACGQNANGKSPRIVDFGIYSADRENPELLSETDQIPATVGTVFGLMMVLDGETTASLSFRWTFPAMQNPANAQIWTEMTGTRMQWPICLRKLRTVQHLGSRPIPSRT